jgi:hypothetical protein
MILGFVGVGFLPIDVAISLAGQSDGNRGYLDLLPQPSAAFPVNSITTLAI